MERPRCKALRSLCNADRSIRSAMAVATYSITYDDPQGGIVARSDGRSAVLTWPSAYPSSSTSTPDQAPDCARILTLAFFGTRLSALQPKRSPPPPAAAAVWWTHGARAVGTTGWPAN